MRIHIMPTLLGAFLSTTLAAQAVEVTGGEVGLSWSAFEDDSDFSKTAIEAAIEVGFTRNIALQFDVGSYSFNASDTDPTAVVLHGIYHLNELTSLGLFAGREGADGSDTDFVGVEAGHEAGAWDMEAYFGNASDEIDDASIYGVQAFYVFDNGASVGLVHDAVSFDSDFDFRTTGIRAVAGFAAADAFVEVGQATADVDGFGSGSETYYGLGVEFKFGAERGATFGRRGLSHFLPGG